MPGVTDGATLSIAWAGILGLYGSVQDTIFLCLTPTITITSKTSIQRSRDIIQSGPISEKQTFSKNLINRRAGDWQIGRDKTLMWKSLPQIQMSSMMVITMISGHVISAYLCPLTPHSVVAVSSQDVPTLHIRCLSPSLSPAHRNSLLPSQPSSPLLITTTPWLLQQMDPVSQTS